VTSVSVGAFHNLARLTDGTVRSWGLNTSGQLGDGTVNNRATPGPVPSVSGIGSLAAGPAHSLAVGGR